MAARPEISVDETLPDEHARDAVASAPELSLPYLFVVLECDRPESGVARHSLSNVDRVALGRGAERSSVRSFEEQNRVLAVSIPDLRMSSRHASIVREGSDFVLHDLGSRNGTRVNRAVVGGPIVLADGDLIQTGHTLLRYRTAVSVPIGEPADVDLGREDAPKLLATIDPSLARRVATLQRVASTTTPILLLGETGTGKEVLARAIHELSERKGPFVAINCGAIPAPLVEAQLFGHVRGAYSGAQRDGLGLLRSTDGGTLLLDEIGDLPPAAQSALLRVLQEREVLPLGAVRTVPVDLRVIAATHKPLDKLVARDEFRSDLYARLAGYTFRLPALRERREDIGWMVAVHATERPLRLTPAAGRALVEYDWPLNVRELHSALDVAAAVADGGPIDLEHLPPAVVGRERQSKHAGMTRVSAEVLHERLIAALKRHRGNVSEVARELGKDRKQVQRWMQRFGVDAGSFRGGGRGE